MQETLDSLGRLLQEWIQENRESLAGPSSGCVGELSLPNGIYKINIRSSLFKGGARKHVHSSASDSSTSSFYWLFCPLVLERPPATLPTRFLFACRLFPSLFFANQIPCTCPNIAVVNVAILSR
mmetsp:Transcript_10095/g.61400  ORF Transcript_10095/g.61400 Transcript_10095/m.61400 type:complete len:124 (+) Transcript_10095:3375-3746(+)